jgi:hypothetical protein
MTNCGKEGKRKGDCSSCQNPFLQGISTTTEKFFVDMTEAICYGKFITKN